MPDPVRLHLFPRRVEVKARYLKPLFSLLEHLLVEVTWKDSTVHLKKGDRHFAFRISTDKKEYSSANALPELPLDQIIRQPEKVAALLKSKLGLNQRVFARNCESRRLSKAVAETFLNQYHLLNATQSAFNYGLFYRNELVALASFSKGRKMNRLPENLRSFELIRFCSKAGITVTGGLSKLMKTFIAEKHPGDIMTYVDAQWSDGAPFVKAGFKKHEQQNPKRFLVNRENFQRTPFTGEEPVPPTHYLSQDAGNIKLIYQVYGKL